MGLHPVFPPLAFTTLVFFGLYLLWEVWRWLAGNRSGLTPGQLRRRLLGGLMLEAALVMWFLANPLMAGRPAREKLLYLLTAMLLTTLPMLLAVREAFFVVRQYSRERARLYRELAAGRAAAPPEREP